MLKRSLFLLFALLLFFTCYSCKHETGRAKSGNETTSVSDASGKIHVVSLPPEAITVLEEINNGGPFAFAKDGAVFHNYERVLPVEPNGYYREYTVPDPGRRGRGAKRIIAGQQGERYYSQDHYNSFKEIIK